MRKVHIYSLADPRDNLIKYIGKTVQKDPKKRFNQHVFQWKRDIGRHNKLNSWIKCLAILGLNPIMDIVDECDESNWKEYERGYIALLKSCGADLKNSTNGGDEPPKNCNSVEAKTKRLKTLETSEAWREGKKDHSAKMKKLHKEGKTLLGYGHLPEKKRKIIGENHSLKMKEIHANNPVLSQKLYEARRIKVYSLKSNGDVDIIFNSITEAGDFYSIDYSSISRVCKGKSVSGKTHGITFKYFKRIKTNLDKKL